MKRYVKASSDNEFTLLSIDTISSIIFVEDPEDMERFSTHDLIATDSVLAAKKDDIDYSLWTREKLLQLKRDHPHEFNKIRDDYVLLKILEPNDLTPDQSIYIHRRKEVSRDVTIAEVKHILKLIYDCKDIRVLPAPKNVEFEDELKKLGIELEPVDVDNILHNLHIKDFSEGSYSTDERYWGNSLLVFGFDNPNYVFSCGKSLPTNALPFGIYIKVDENLVTKKSVIVVSFHRAKYEMQHPFNYPVEKETPDTWD